jgi:hypothetical protein
MKKLLIIFISALTLCVFGCATEDGLYNAYMSTPNIGEVCRAASRPNDTMTGALATVSKQAAFRAINDRNLECDWSSEMEFWRDFSLATAKASIQNVAKEKGLFVRREHFSGEADKCIYTNGTTRIRIKGFSCPTTN